MCLAGKDQLYVSVGKEKSMQSHAGFLNLNPKTDIKKSKVERSAREREKVDGLLLEGC